MHSSDIVLTTYLTEFPDPQTGPGHLKRYEPDQVRLMKLLPSALSRDMEMHVFHDQLSDEFCNDLTETHGELLSFMPRVSLLVGESCNDARFRIYKDWLADLISNIVLTLVSTSPSQFVPRHLSRLRQSGCPSDRPMPHT